MCSRFPKRRRDHRPRPGRALARVCYRSSPLLGTIYSIVETNVYTARFEAVAERHDYPVTPDGRYFVVRGRLWRTPNPRLSPAERGRLVGELMDARRAVGAAQRADDPVALAEARAAVDAAKRALGERGPPWWSDGAPDYGRRLARNTPYADWYAGLADAGDSTDAPR